MNRPLHGGNLVWAAALANCSPSAILDFSASINPLGPPTSAIAAIQQHLSTIAAYPDPGCHQLRLALSEFHQIPPTWILPGNGAAELLTWGCREMAALNGAVVLSPAFSDYGRALAAHEARVVYRPLKLSSAGLEPDDRWLDLDPANCGIVINNPHNPTGRLFSRDWVLSCVKAFSLVIVDEAFMDFLPPDRQQSVIEDVQQHSNLVVLRSLTKFYSIPGLRLGYAIASPERLQHWQRWRDPWAVNSLSLAVGEAVVRDRAFQQKTWNWLPPAKSRLFEGLQNLAGLKPLWGAANFLLVESSRSVTELQEALLRRHQILIRDCLSFPELGDRFFRVAVRSEAENQRLLEALSDVLAESTLATG